jgi:hypothetical protein
MMTNTIAGTPSNHASKYLPIRISLKELQITNLLIDRPLLRRMSGAHVIFRSSIKNSNHRIERLMQSYQADQSITFSSLQRAAVAVCALPYKA